MSRSICLNADIGELPGPEGRALDRAILDIVSRCSIACGGHAGDAESMQATLRAARARQVAVGVHPSYPDRENFGRAPLSLDNDSLLAALRSQVRAFQAIARELSIATVHLKPHGALYNEAAADRGLAGLVVQIARETMIPAIIGPPDSELEAEAGRMGLRFIAEGFADRRYTDDGRLVSRAAPGAVITGTSEQAAQVLSIIERGMVEAQGGNPIPMRVETICLHGDTPGAVESALALRDLLRAGNVRIEAADAS